MNQGKQWEYVSDREKQAAVDGGDGSASVTVNPDDETLLEEMKTRLASDPKSDPTTGADLGAGSGAGTTKKVTKEKT